MQLIETNKKLQNEMDVLKRNIRTLKKKNQRSLKIITQWEDKFNNMLNMGKHKGDVTGIGYGTNVPKPNKTPRNGVRPKTAIQKEKYPIQVGKKKQEIKQTKQTTKQENIFHK